jgi:hypothetical protein
MIQSLSMLIMRESCKMSTKKRRKAKRRQEIMSTVQNVESRLSKNKMSKTEKKTKLNWDVHIKTER